MKLQDAAPERMLFCCFFVIACTLALPIVVPFATGAEAAKERVLAGTATKKTLIVSTLQPASVRAYEEAPLYARIAGYVQSVAVDIGDQVKAGQVLAVIDAPELKNEVAQQRALVAQAESDWKQSQAAVQAVQARAETAKANLRGVEAGLMRTQGEMSRWNAEFERVQELASRGTITPKVADETLNQMRAAEAAVAETKAAIESARALVDEATVNVAKAEVDVMAAQARVDVAKANLARAETMAGFAELRSPMDGRITLRTIDRGHSVFPVATPTTRPLLVVTQDSTLRVTTSIPEREAAYVTLGQDPVTITVQSLNNRTILGKVSRTSWSLDADNRSLRVEADVANDQGDLRPGMYATMQIQLEKRENVLTLPATAIVNDATGGTRCCIVVEDKIQFRPIRIGIRAGADIEIVEGITSSDTVVMARAAALTPGQAVELLPATK